MRGGDHLGADSSVVTPSISSLTAQEEEARLLQQVRLQQPEQLQQGRQQEEELLQGKEEEEI
jgi:hypothetical protein